MSKKQKPNSEETLLNWRQFRRDKLPLFMPGKNRKMASVLAWHE